MLPKRLSAGTHQDLEPSLLDASRALSRQPENKLRMAPLCRKLGLEQNDFPVWAKKCFFQVQWATGVCRIEDGSRFLMKRRI